MRYSKMKKIILFTTLLLLSFGSAGEVLTFGKAINTEVTIKISTILATPKNYLNNDVTIEGTIIGVCSRRGCWMELASDAKFEKIRIKVRDGEMVFPMHAKGRKALVTGMLKEIVLSLDQKKNYKTYLAKRDGKPIDIKKITSPMTIYQLSPAGVKVLD